MDRHPHAEPAYAASSLIGDAWAIRDIIDGFEHDRPGALRRILGCYLLLFARTSICGRYYIRRYQRRGIARGAKNEFNRVRAFEEGGSVPNARPLFTRVMAANETKPIATSIDRNARL